MTEPEEPWTPARTAVVWGSFTAAVVLLLGGVVTGSGWQIVLGLACAAVYFTARAPSPPKP